MHKVILVDDEENVLKALKRALATEPYDIEIYTNGVDVLERAKTTAVDLVLSDYRMPAMDGVALLTELKKLQPDTMRLIISGYTDLEALLAAINQAEIYHFISKPWKDYELKATLSQALAHRAVLLENKRLADQVRAQQTQLVEQHKILEKLETESPGSTQVRWAEDGSIILGEDDI
jgi:YesN/AraC family two-component response regulator